MLGLESRELFSLSWWISPRNTIISSINVKSVHNNKWWIIRPIISRVVVKHTSITPIWRFTHAGFVPSIFQCRVFDLSRGVQMCAGNVSRSEITHLSLVRMLIHWFDDRWLVHSAPKPFCTLSRFLHQLSHGSAYFPPLCVRKWSNSTPPFRVLPGSSGGFIWAAYARLAKQLDFYTFGRHIWTHLSSLCSFTDKYHKMLIELLQSCKQSNCSATRWNRIKFELCFTFREEA